MHGTAAAQDSAVLDGDMSSQHHIVRQDDMAAEATIMRHMRIGEEQVVIADNRLAAAIGAARIHRNAFAHDAARTDLERRFRAIVANCLRCTANNGHWMDDRTTANDG
ncbi:hypothetical protein D3C87_1737540 [compost metagenome]